MKEKSIKINLNQQRGKKVKEDNLNGYPPYPPSEDIYGKCQKDRKIDPENPASTKVPSHDSKTGKFNEKDFEDDVTGEDLDIPGSELDDDLEIIGSEDEENNYYSLGGDDHNDLDEDYVE
jgi:hypothetical protein